MSLSVLHSFLLLNSIPLYYIIQCFFNCLSLLGQWVVPSFYLEVPIDFYYKYFYEHEFSFLLGKYLPVEWLDYVVGIVTYDF